MSRRFVFISLASTLIALAGADALTERLAMNSVPRQVIRRIASAPQMIDVLGIGNSLIAAGFDSAEIERELQQGGSTTVAINGGLGATGVIEHLALTRLALQDHKVKTLVYGFFDNQLSYDLISDNADIIGNKNIVYYLEPELTLKYARFGVLGRTTFQIYRSSALLRERSSLWAKIEKLRRKLGSAGMPHEEANQFGRSADFSLLEAKTPRDFDLSCQKVIQDGDYLSLPVRALLREARDRGVRVVVVEMPMHPMHVKQFYCQPVWAKLRMQNRLAVERIGAAYLNASEWIPDQSLFADHLHLSSEGARQFSRLLAGRLNHDLKLSASADRK